MRTLRAQVMALPPEDRLEHALFLLEEITGRPSERLVALRDKWGLSPQEARLFLALNEAAPRVMSKESLLVAVSAGGEVTGVHLIPTLICHLKVKMGRVCTIQNVRGIGYRAQRRLEIPLSAPSVPGLQEGAPWSSQDDADLLLMIATGSDWDVIAEELGRTRQAVLTRSTKLRLAGQWPRRAA